MPKVSKRILAIMDPEEKTESMKERRAEKKNPAMEAKEKKPMQKKNSNLIKKIIKAK
jgi:hypothetical protein